MANTNKVLLKCSECGGRRFVFPSALLRASRVRCLDCGSYRLDVSDHGAGTLLARNNAVRAEDVNMRSDVTRPGRRSSRRYRM